ncbi:MAG: hypothetical protein C4K48_08400 [Candidatus Thorarchaeota archaeon]|nr:MAG: hypothetical protein C4K48_08400 [Candidatus Thorarchaeota archaeon]
MVRVHTTKATGRVLVARLLPGEDILSSIEKIADENKIQSAHFSMIGAVSRVHLGYFDRELNSYKDFTVEEDLEVVSGIGNVSRHDGKYVVHAHIVVADEIGRCYGGHLLGGCEVSVTIELVITEIPEMTRTRDEKSGLNLLNI